MGRRVSNHPPMASHWRVEFGSSIPDSRMLGLVHISERSDSRVRSGLLESRLHAMESGPTSRMGGCDPRLKTQGCCHSRLPVVLQSREHLQESKCAVEEGTYLLGRESRPEDKTLRESVVLMQAIAQPPGNGKTVSIKAIMKDVKVPILYVKSFRSKCRLCPTVANSDQWLVSRVWRRPTRAL